jgi:hypothetical protein
MLVNKDHDNDHDVKVGFRFGENHFHVVVVVVVLVDEHHGLTKDAEDKTYVELRPERTLEVTTGLSDRIPPMSIVVYSTYRLNPEDPGVITEE